MNKKILATIAISHLSIYSVFAQNSVQNFSCPQLKFNLHKGSVDARTKGEVTVLQKFLKQNLNLSDNQFLVTGSYGKVTEKYVKDYEKINNLIINGSLDKSVRDSIYSSCGNVKKDTGEVKKVIEKVTSKFEDGNYNVVGEYNSPQGADTILVKISLQNDKILKLNVTKQSDGTSGYFQEKFIACQSSLLGKEINNLKIDTVCGASLTTNGFNDALKKIRTQALN